MCRTYTREVVLPEGRRPRLVREGIQDVSRESQKGASGSKDR